MSPGGSSSRCSGGSGESGRSSNSGFCFSLMTRSDFAISMRGRLDADRLVFLETLALDFDDFLALLGRLLARLAVLVRMPFVSQEQVAVLDRPAQFFDEGDPGHAREQGDPDAAQDQQQQGTACETENFGEQPADHSAQDAARRLGKLGLQRIQAQRLDGAAGEYEQQETAAGYGYRASVCLRR